MLENLDDVVLPNDDIRIDDLESDIFTFFGDDMQLFTIDLDDNNVGEDANTIIHVGPMA